MIQVFTGTGGRRFQFSIQRSKYICIVAQKLARHWQAMPPAAAGGGWLRLLAAVGGCRQLMEAAICWDPYFFRKKWGVHCRSVVQWRDSLLTNAKVATRKDLPSINAEFFSLALKASRLPSSRMRGFGLRNNFLQWTIFWRASASVISEQLSGWEEAKWSDIEIKSRRRYRLEFEIKINEWEVSFRVRIFRKKSHNWKKNSCRFQLL